jgi:hypothetical protein
MEALFNDVASNRIFLLEHYSSGFREQFFTKLIRSTANKVRREQQLGP